jgi:hypothetical protein
MGGFRISLLRGKKPGGLGGMLLQKHIKTRTLHSSICLEQFFNFGEIANVCFIIVFSHNVVIYTHQCLHDKGRAWGLPYPTSLLLLVRR